MSNIILTSDLHLDDAPSNEYRWEVWDAIERANPDALYILGDLSHKKDKHAGALVNRVTQHLQRFTKHGVEVTILKGNHDAPLAGVPYWSWLNDIPHVSFVTEPTADNRLLMLPHTPDPHVDWQSIDFTQFSCIMMHYTTNQVQIGGGRVLHVEHSVVFPKNVLLVSGDIHIPQFTNGIHYIGAPHPIFYGDDHPFRLVSLQHVGDKFLNWKDIELHPKRKHAIIVQSADALYDYDVRPGEQAKIELHLPANAIDMLPAEQAKVEAWARAKGVTIPSIQTIVATSPENVADDDVDFGDPVAILIAFAETEGIEESLLNYGYTILEPMLPLRP